MSFTYVLFWSDVCDTLWIQCAGVNDITAPWIMHFRLDMASRGKSFAVASVQTHYHCHVFVCTHTPSAGGAIFHPRLKGGRGGSVRVAMVVRSECWARLISLVYDCWCNRSVTWDWSVSLLLSFFSYSVDTVTWLTPPLLISITGCDNTGSGQVTVGAKSWVTQKSFTDGYPWACV